MREFEEHVGHLISALAASDEDDDIGVRPFRELMLHNRLPAAEGSGTQPVPPLVMGKNMSMTRWPVIMEFPAEASCRGPGNTDRPALHEGAVHVARLSRDNRDRFLDRKLSREWTSPYRRL